MRQERDSKPSEKCVCPTPVQRLWILLQRICNNTSGKVRWFGPGSPFFCWSWVVNLVLQAPVEGVYTQYQPCPLDAYITIPYFRALPSPLIDSRKMLCWRFLWRPRICEPFSQFSKPGDGHTVTTWTPKGLSSTRRVSPSMCKAALHEQLIPRMLSVVSHNKAWSTNPNTAESWHPWRLRC